MERPDAEQLTADAVHLRSVAGWFGREPQICLHIALLHSALKRLVPSHHANDATPGFYQTDSRGGQHLVRPASSEHHAWPRPARSRAKRLVPGAGAPPCIFVCLRCIATVDTAKLDTFPFPSTD